MEYDASGAIEIAEGAANFDWTWKPDDIGRFAEAIGWSILNTDRFGAIFETHLDVPMAKASASCEIPIFKSRRVARSLQSISAYPADFKDAPKAAGTVLQAETFADLGVRFVDRLGIPDSAAPYGPPELSWSRSNVVIVLFSGSGHITLEIRNPGYHDWLLQDREDRNDEEE